MHSVLRHFVDAAGGWLDLLPEEMIQRQTAFSDGVGFLDSLGHIDFGERGGFQQSAPGCQLSGKRGGKRAACSVKLIFVGLFTCERYEFCVIDKHVGGALHMSALDD